jgi:hypothetical protein
VHCSLLGGVTFGEEASLLESMEFMCRLGGGCIVAAMAGIP